MRFIVVDRDGNRVGSVYGPNYETALKRAIKQYGMEVEIEEM